MVTGSRVSQRLIAPSIILVATIFVFSFGYYFLCGIPEHGIGPTQEKRSYLDCLYFSVVTISSLGYGDLHPLGFSRVLAAIEVVSGLVFIGVFVARIVSVKQDEMAEYIVTSKIVQTYDECLEHIRGAKEDIADLRRTLQHTQIINPEIFRLNKNNPFYSAKRALEVVNGYAKHVIEIERVGVLDNRLDRTAHHVEELAGVIKRFIIKLDRANTSWRTKRSKNILLGINQLLEEFCEKITPHTKYMQSAYKGPCNYQDVLKNHIKEINTLVNINTPNKAPKIDVQRTV